MHVPFYGSDYHFPFLRGRFPLCRQFFIYTVSYHFHNLCSEDQFRQEDFTSSKLIAQFVHTLAEAFLKQFDCCHAFFSAFVHRLHRHVLIRLNDCVESFLHQFFSRHGFSFSSFLSTTFIMQFCIT